MNTDNNPMVSIIIPVYNGSNYMREAIDSALSQTYKNIEIIVVNDGSDDNGETERIALSYKDKIRYYKKENGGVSTALNLGINVMHGDYFSWLSHDDKYAPQKIERQIELIKECGDSSAIVLCGSSQIDKDSRPMSDVHSRKRFDENTLINWDVVLLDLFQHGSFNGCALLIPREVFDKCGFFHEGLRFSQDYLMWIRIFLAEYSLIYCDENLVYGRVHSGQLTQRGQNLFHHDSEVIGDLLIDKLTEISSNEYNFLYSFARNNAIYNNCAVVTKCIESAEKHHLFGIADTIKLKCYLGYGRIRPAIRKLYYLIIKHVRT